MGHARKIIALFYTVILSIAFAMPAAASYLPFNTSVHMNVGIGSTNPGQSLDVQGTVRALYFLGNGSQLTGVTSTVWNTTNTNDVYLPNSGNVGIGTTITSAGAALSVMNGNVGIGTWVPKFSLDVSGAVNSSTGYYFGGSSSPLSINLTRSISGTVNNTVEIGNFSIGNGAHAFRIAVTVNTGGFSVAKSYLVSINYGAGGWFELAPLSDSGPYNGENFAVDITGSASNVASLRIRKNAGTTAGTAQIRIESVGDTTDVFTATSATASGVTPPTAYYSSMYTLPVGIPFVNIGAYSLTNWNGTGYGISTQLTSPVNDGGSTPNATFPSMILGRAGVSGQAYDNIVEFKLGRFENVSTAARTQMDIAMTNGVNDSVGTNIMSLRSNGNVGIGTTVPTGRLEIEGGNVGIGTAFTTTSALSIMNGNVGIGTWSPNASFQVLGNVGIGTTGTYVTTSPPSGGAIVQGNVGIGTWLTPVQFNVTGTASFGIPGYQAPTTHGTTNFTSSGGAAVVLQYPAGVGADSSPFIALYENPSIDNRIGFIQGGSVDAGPTVDFTIGADIGRLRLRSANGGGEIDVQSGVAMGNFANAQSDSPLANSLVVGGNVGVGTNYPINQFVVNGAVGIGTANSSYVTTVAPSGGMLVQGNVGIGSLTPGQKLDVQGTVRALYFSGNGSQLTGISSSQWTTTNTNDVYLSSNGNVGLGTTITSAGAALSVMNGNVGIGTWVPGHALEVGNGGALSVLGLSAYNSSIKLSTASGEGYVSARNLADTGNQTLELIGSKIAVTTGGLSVGSGYYANAISDGNAIISGNVGIGTTITSAGAALSVMNGNVGIGTWIPAGALDIKNGNNLLVENGNVQVNNGSFYAGNQVRDDSVNLYGGIYTLGIRSYTWIAKSEDIFRFESHLVTAGKNTLEVGSQAGATFVAIDHAGNMGIGSATPGQILDVQGTLRVLGGGSVGIGTSLLSTSALTVMSGNVGIGTWIPASGLSMKTSFAVYRTTTAVTATTAGQTIIGVTDTSAPRSVHLATVDLAPGRVIIIKDESGVAATNNITIDGQGGQTIDGQASVTISANYGVLRVYSDGSNWFTF